MTATVVHEPAWSLIVVLGIGMLLGRELAV